MQHLPGIVPLYTAVEMRTLDRLAIDEIGLPEAVLMERAGLSAAEEILEWFPHAHTISIACGAGRNGGDGFVVARHLAEAGRDVQVLLVESASKIRRESKLFLSILEKLDIPFARINVTGWRNIFDGADLIVDALLGTGIDGAPKPNYKTAIDAINSSGVPIVALDIPSGVDASTGEVEGSAVNADLTFTFHAPKVGVAIAPGRFHAGRVKALKIGIPEQIIPPFQHGIATNKLLSVLPERSRAGTKYDATVLAIGGSASMSGAIALTTQAAMRAGAGVVWAAVPDRISGALDVAIPEVQFRGMLSDDRGVMTVAAAERLGALVAKTDTIVLGPGIGDGDQVRALARWAIREAPALVLDAQGISAFANDTQAIAARDGLPTLLTPHEGELATLLGVSIDAVRTERLKCAREAALATQATVLLKGEDTIVALPGGDFLVCGGYHAQATAGTGDVLAGVAAALLARGLDPVLAGACAALGCAQAARRAAQSSAPIGVIASDLLREIPAALADYNVSTTDAYSRKECSEGGAC